MEHPHRIVRAATLRPGPALVVVRLPDDTTIRSQVTMVTVEPHLTKVAFASGDQLAFGPRAVVGIIAPARGRGGIARPRGCGTVRPLPVNQASGAEKAAVPPRGARSHDDEYDEHATITDLTRDAMLANYLKRRGSVR